MNRDVLLARLVWAYRANGMLLVGTLCLLAGVGLVATPWAAGRAGLLAGAFVVGLGLGLVVTWGVLWQVWSEDE